jgi:hypothetical protein
MPHCSLVKLFVQSGLLAYDYFFFSECCDFDVCDHLSLPYTWLISYNSYSPIAPTAPSLRPFVPSGSLIRCEPAQVCKFYHRSKVPLDPVYHVIYPGDYLVWALQWELELERFPLLAGWTIEPHIVVLVITRALGQSVVTCFHSVPVQLQALPGIIVDIVQMFP